MVSLDQQTESAKNRSELEAVSRFAAQSARCTVRRVGMVLIFPEDFGGHVRDGPASPLSSREFQELECACDVRRGSAFLCQLASTDQRRPVGILANLPTLHWLILERCGDELFYQSPLPESCPCVPAHAPFKGTDAQEHFVSSSSKSPGTEFWKVCLADLSMDSFRFPWGWGFYPASEQRPHILTLFVFSLQGSTLCSLVERFVLAGLAQGLREPWTGGTLLFWLSCFFAAVVVFLLFSSTRHVTGLGSVFAYVAIIVGILTLTLAVLYVSQVSFSFSCCGYMEILTWSFENSPGPHEAEGLLPTWLCL